MKYIILSITVLSFLMACAPKTGQKPASDISDEMTRPMSADFESDSAMEDEMTRPISPGIENSEEEIDYGQKVWDTLYKCFLSFVTETDEPDTYISANGTQIRIIEQANYEGERLTEADKANGILWQGRKWIDFIYIDKKSGEWKEEKLYFDLIRYYADGKMTRYSVLSDIWKDFSFNDVVYIGEQILFED